MLASQGIWASALELPDQMSGLFLRHSTIGLAILVNARHVRARKRFSYAHEFAHALMDRNARVKVSSADNAADLVEKRANAFATAFLMPRAGVVEMLTQLDKGRPSRSEQSIFDVANDSAFDADIRPVPRSQNILAGDDLLVLGEAARRLNSVNCQASDRNQERRSSRRSERYASPSCSQINSSSSESSRTILRRRPSGSCRMFRWQMSPVLEGSDVMVHLPGRSAGDSRQKIGGLPATPA